MPPHVGTANTKAHTEPSVANSGAVMLLLTEKLPAAAGEARHCVWMVIRITMNSAGFDGATPTRHTRRPDEMSFWVIVS